MYIPAGVALLNMLLIALFLPESRTRQSRGTFSLRLALPHAGVALLLQDVITRRVVLVEVGAMAAFVSAATITPELLTGLGWAPYIYYSSSFLAIAIGAFSLPLWIGRFGVIGTIRVACFALFALLPLQALPFNVVGLEPHRAMLASVFNCVNIVGGLFDAPCRTLTVSRHDAKMYGLATAGLVTVQCFMQGTVSAAPASLPVARLSLMRSPQAAQAVTAIHSFGDEHDMPWLQYASVAVYGLFALGVSMTIPSVIRRKQDKL